MLDGLALLTSFLFLCTGAIVLFGDVSKLDMSQNVALFGGATLMSVGLVTLVFTVRSTWVARQNLRKWRNGQHSAK
jgi:hypothetical protein